MRPTLIVPRPPRSSGWRWRVVRRVLRVMSAVLLAFAAAGAASAQQGGTGSAPQRVIVVQSLRVAATEAHLTWFQRGLVEQGYVLGRTLEVTVIRADGDPHRAEAGLRAALAAGPADVVVTIATLASQAAQRVLRGTDIPLFFFQVGAPVEAGLVPALDRPCDTPVTGRAYFVPARGRLRTVLRIVAPAARGRPVRLGLIHSDYPSAEADAAMLAGAARALGGATFVTARVRYRPGGHGMDAMLAEARTAARRLAPHVDYWWEPGGPLGETQAFSAMLLETTAVPIAMGQRPDSVRMGALLRIAPDWVGGAREAAALVAEILRGRDPRTIVPRASGATLLSLNLATALRHGLLVPPDVLKLAGARVYPIRSP